MELRGGVRGPLGRCQEADVVELAPIGGNAAPDFVVAKLVYKMVGYHWAARGVKS